MRGEEEDRGVDRKGVKWRVKCGGVECMVQRVELREAERSREERYDRREEKRERVKEMRGNRKGWWRGVERSSAVEWSSIVEKCNV